MAFFIPTTFLTLTVLAQDYYSLTQLLYPNGCYVRMGMKICKSSYCFSSEDVVLEILFMKGSFREAFMGRIGKRLIAFSCCEKQQINVFLQSQKEICQEQ